tara:strand:+ start:265 stop:492 length:228 start_codon:yes stop_codon:yes gene_type:complete
LIWIDLRHFADLPSGRKLKNYDVAKQVGLEVKQRNTDSEQWDRAYENRVVSVAVSRKKKVAIDTIKSVVKGIFPS